MVGSGDVVQRTVSICLRNVIQGHSTLEHHLMFGKNIMIFDFIDISCVIALDLVLWTFGILLREQLLS
jgi:hypothetical protein